MRPEIPTEGHIPLLDLTIPIHWENHAILMFVVWFVLVPAALLAVRYGKTPPATYGIPRGTPRLHARELCWTLHGYTLRLAMLPGLGGVAFATLVAGGFSGSLHALFGTAATVLGVLQVVSAWLRGSHGGRKDKAADPDDRRTWGGDHFDMTPRRRWFEAWHKTAGYFAQALALGAVATGLGQFWIGGIAVALAALVGLGLLLAVVLQGLGCHHDTYLSVYGTHPDHPYNRRRFRGMIEAQGERP